MGDALSVPFIVSCWRLISLSLFHCWRYKITFFDGWRLTSLRPSYTYVPPQRVGFFPLFWSGIRYGFRGLYLCERIHRFNFKWGRKRVWILEARSENECEKWHLLVWNRVRIDLENWVAHPHHLGFNSYFNFSVLSKPVSRTLTPIWLA